MQVEGEKKPRQVRVDHFPRGGVLMNQLMGILMKEVARVPVLNHRLYQANFHTTLSGEAMVRCSMMSNSSACSLMDAKGTLCRRCSIVRKRRAVVA